MRGKIEARAPMPITKRRLFPMPRELAAAIGPGVGGINTCEIYKPADRATVIATLEILVL